MAPTQEAMAYQAFLSHSSRDRELVERFRDRAGAAGVNVYLAEHDVQTGVVLSKKVQAAIDRSNVVVVLLTPNSHSSAYVQQEVGYAIRAGKLVLPVVEKSVPQSAFAMLEGVEYIVLDFEAPHGAVARLSEQLERRATDQLRTEVIVAIVVITVLVVLLAHE